MHSHGMSSGSMGSMFMGNEAPDMFYLQKMYWAVIGTAIGIALLANILDNLLLWQRTANAEVDAPARPKSIALRTYATITAITREVSNAALTSAGFGRRSLSSVTLGRLSLVVSNMIVVLVLCFYKLDTENHRQWEDVAYRCGFIAAAQLPLVVLLAGKRNIIGFLIGSSYERLSWLHRWVARTLFLTVTIHMAFWFRSWDRYKYIGTKVKTDPMARSGLAAWSILLWIVLSSFAPMRRWNYEFFLAQHILTFIGFLAAVYIHLPHEVKAYVWIPIVVYAFDRLVRLAFMTFTNLATFHPRLKCNGLLTCEAKLTPLSGGMSRVSIKNPPISWRPGQHVFLQCHRIAPLQSHPFTIASIPQDGCMEFLVKSRTGATKRFLSSAEKCHRLPAYQNEAGSGRTFAAIIDGPYGNMRPLRQFDSVVLIGGGCGASFTIPLMRDIVHGWQRPATQKSFFHRSTAVVTRHVRLVWVVKSRKEYSWFTSQLSQAMIDTQTVQHGPKGVKLDISIYITCDTILDAKDLSSPKASDTIDKHAAPSEASSSSDISISPTKPLMTTSVAPDTRAPPSKACGVDGTCCCATVIIDEDQPDATIRQRQCHCNDARSSHSSDIIPATKLLNNSTPPSSNESLHAEKPSSSPSSPQLVPAISLLTGRPHCKTLIRKVLEGAKGESAVVVCGPRGLNDDVRNCVVRLSDERAVHKGTGAQGIYFWDEGFEY